MCASHPHTKPVTLLSAKKACHSAGEAAVHLLGRMLAFDPGRRISAEEALCHEYFAALESSAVSELGKSL